MEGRGTTGFDSQVFSLGVGGNRCWLGVAMDQGLRDVEALFGLLVRVFRFGMCGLREVIGVTKLSGLGSWVFEVCWILLMIRGLGCKRKHHAKTLTTSRVPFSFMKSPRATAKKSKSI